MDLSSMNVVAAASDARPMSLLHPHTQEETGVVLMVLGYDSDPVASASRSFNAKLLHRRRKMQPDELFNARRHELAKAAVVGLAPDSEDLQINEAILYEALGRDEPADAKKKVSITVPSKEFSALLKHPGFSFISVQVEKFGDDRGNYSPEVLNA